MGDESFKNIEALIEGIQQMADKVYPDYRQEVNIIIQSKISNPDKIEHLFGRMLDFCFDDKFLELYKKLSRYYYNIDPKTTAFYVLEYRDMWDSEEELLCCFRTKQTAVYFYLLT
jgi:hypothetical protein